MSHVASCVRVGGARTCDRRPVWPPQSTDESRRTASGRRAYPACVRVVTWNVNSIRQRLPRLLALLARHEPDVVCLQETKVADADFPIDALNEAGYGALSHGQGGRNGVAIVARLPLEEV